MKVPAPALSLLQVVMRMQEERSHSVKSWTIFFQGRTHQLEINVAEERISVLPELKAKCYEHARSIGILSQNSESIDDFSLKFCRVVTSERRTKEGSSIERVTALSESSPIAEAESVSANNTNRLGYVDHGRLLDPSDKFSRNLVRAMTSTVWTPVIYLVAT